MPSRPNPGRTRTSVAVLSLISRVASANALAMGCSDAPSSDPAIFKHTGAGTLPNCDALCRRTSPRVSVPVLSNTTRSTFESDSMASAFVTSTPCRASSPVAAASAAGIASENAHGQATTSTASVASKARDGSRLSQIAHTPPAAISTYRKNFAAARSAACATAGFCDCARRRSETMPDNNVSLPIAVTRTVSGA